MRAPTVLNNKKLTTMVNRDVAFGLESENMAARELKYLIFSNCRISTPLIDLLFIIPVED